ncbi:Ubiquitin-related modifier 1-like protein [Entamoeba marina]
MITIELSGDVFVYIQKNVHGLSSIFDGDTVVPGIIILVNDADWELIGMLNAEVNDGDVISLISSIHGG